MDAKLTKLLSLLEESSEIVPADLAESLSVSTRSIRTYVSRLNNLLAPAAHIDLKRGHGYRLTVEDAEAFKAHAAAFGANYSRSTPSTATERVVYLLNDLLNRNGWVTLDELASILFVSRVTISDDLHEVEDRLSKFGLSLERKPYRGIRISGSEFSRRLCLAACAAITDGAPSDGLISPSMLEAVAECVTSATSEAGVQVNAAAYQNLLIHIAVAVERVRKGCYVPLVDEQMDLIRQSPAFECARLIADQIGDRFGIELPNEEIAYISIHLAGKQTLYDACRADPAIESFVISDEVWDVVSRMLDRIWATFRFDFRRDIELRMNLARHIVPLSVRLKYRMHLDNPLLADIQGRFPLAYAMATESCLVLSDAYGARLSNAEVGYIALAFALALDRQAGEPVKKNILVVCASGAGTARLLEHRYRKEFGAFLDRIETCDVHALDGMSFDGIDYVFTTIPLKSPLPVPVREVGFFLDDADYEGVHRALSNEEKVGNIGDYFDPRLFLSHLVVRDKAEVIHELCERIASFRQASQDLEGLVWKREEAAATSFGNLVAIPHPYEPVFDTTFVCVAILDHAIDWDSVPVQVVFMVCVAKGKGKALSEFYRAMAELLTDKAAIGKLISQQSYSTLLEVMQV